MCEWAYEEDLSLGKGIWLHADESGDIERVAELVCEFQKRFAAEQPWTLEYAVWCSKPRIGEFGGGAVFCHRGEATFMNSGAWTAETAAVQRVGQEDA